jgi:hypothetical protein
MWKNHKEDERFEEALEDIGSRRSQFSLLEVQEAVYEGILVSAAYESVLPSRGVRCVACVMVVS